MQVDAATLTIASGFAALVCGVFLIAAGWRYKIGLTLGAWGLSAVASAAGMALFATDLWLDIGHALLIVASGLAWYSAAKFSGRRMPLSVLVVTSLVVFATAAGTVEQILTYKPTLLISATLLFGAISEFWRSRSESLKALRPLIGLLLAHTLFVMTGGIVSIANAGQTAALDAFAFLNLEVMVYVVGSSIAYILLVKERSISAEKIAASRDWLTGLLDRGAFVEAAQPALIESVANKRFAIGIMFDLDEFKKINDTFGHAAGDAVLRCFAVVVSRAMQPGDIAGRIGGDEIAILSAATGRGAGIALANRICEDFRRECARIDGQHVCATASGGLFMTQAEISLDELFVKADQALYAAKHRGGNCIEISDDPPRNVGEPAAQISSWGEPRVADQVIVH